MAASECMSQQAAEIPSAMCLFRCSPCHAATCGLYPPGRYWHGRVAPGADGGELTTARSADSYPAFSPMLVEWRKRAGCWRRLRCSTANCVAAVAAGPAAFAAALYTACCRPVLTGINRDRLQQDFVQWTQEWRNQSCRMQTVKSQAH